MMMSIAKNKAFTLIELLVVIAIIGLLSSIVLVSTKGVREKARLAKAQKFDSSIQHALGSEAVGIWRFEEASGSSLMTHDESGYGNDGELKGDAHIVPAVGLYPDTNAMSFDGSGDYVDCGSDDSLDITDEITISAWVKTTGGSTERGIYAQGSGFAGVSNPGFSLRIRQGVPAFAVRKGDNSGYWDLYTGTNVEDGKWHHIVGTFDTSKMYRYLDGKLEQQGDTGQTALGALGSKIGVLNGKYFNGTIDDVRIYDTALSTAEIQQHYAEGAKKYGIAEK